jgi:chromate reductase
MLRIIAGTNRPGSNTLKVSKICEGLLKNLNEEVEIIDLRLFPSPMLDGSQYHQNQPDKLIECIDKITAADGLVMVTPEYNGSFPGVLKYFIDHWRFPDSFEYRPVCFIGLGGRFGGLQAVQHIQQIFLYRNAFIYPERVLLSNVQNIVTDQSITDPVAAGLVEKQMKGFSQFVRVLQAAKLDANSRRQRPT